MAKMKNKAPEEVQITAVQLLCEAKERDLEILPPPPKQKTSPPARTAELFQAYSTHEKYGDGAGVKDVIVSERKYQYEQEVAENRLPAPHRSGGPARPDPRDVRADHFECAAVEREELLAALHLELEAEEAEHTRQIYKTCLEQIPHKQFTFSKLWLLYA
ncbi:protein crooked neck-like [Drosophila serrata]|uniref:protein crooked neck-like n=1 Tax=Drosophila serrata TaxID=7274 RepID=UPI000A1D2426|nr:protein crooked neck-like [Drosophila serrata]